MSEDSQNELDQTPGCGKKRDRSATEERLIQAGLELFAQHGFDGTTTRMIAKHADTNESLIARYFEGKEGLLVAVIEKFISDVVAQELPYPPQETVVDELILYTEERIRNGYQKCDFARIIFSQAIVNAKFRKNALENLPLDFDQRLRKRLRLLQKRNLIAASVNIDEICFEIDAFMNGLFFFEVILRELPREVVVEHALAFIRRFEKCLK